MNEELQCDCECAFVEPYGFVPEADCPVHDPPDDDSTELDWPEMVEEIQPRI